MNSEEREQEKSNGTVWLERSSFRIALLSTFTALAVVIGYMLGKRDGAIAGLMSSFIFVFFNPYGVSPLPLFAYQLAHYSLVGFLGGISHNFLSKKDYFKPDIKKIY